MADEAPFQLLHSELIQYIYKSAEGEAENGRNITKLENMGFRVGQGLIERLTKDTARFKDELDVMKFICKDFWTCVFKKQIDNLRTNHQGIYVLQDNKFRFLSHLSVGKQYLEHAPKYHIRRPFIRLIHKRGASPDAHTRCWDLVKLKGGSVRNVCTNVLEKLKTGDTVVYLAFTCGLVRGALSSLGVKSIVTAEVSVMPSCKFQVMIQKM